MMDAKGGQEDRSAETTTSLERKSPSLSFGLEAHVN